MTDGIKRVTEETEVCEIVLEAKHRDGWRYMEVFTPDDLLAAQSALVESRNWSAKINVGIREYRLVKVTVKTVKEVIE